MKWTLFGAPEVKLSAVGGSVYLAHILPPQIQRAMSYCGTFLAAEEVHEKFVSVTIVVDTPESLKLAAIAKVEELCCHGPLCCGISNSA